MDYQQATIGLTTPKITPKAQTGREVGWMVVCKIALFPKKASFELPQPLLFPPLALFGHIPVHEKLFFN
jgi:hypothetical protein